MEAIDLKLMEAVKALPEDLKKQVLGYIQSLKTQSTEKKLDAKGKIKSTAGYGGAKDLAKYTPDNLDKISVSEDFEEYL